MSVVSLNGGPTGERQVNEDTVETLEELLEKARSGHVVGLGAVVLEHNGVSEWRLVGRVGGFNMLGATDVLMAEVREIARGD